MQKLHKNLKLFLALSRGKILKFQDDKFRHPFLFRSSVTPLFRPILS